VKLVRILYVGARNKEFEHCVHVVMVYLNAMAVAQVIGPRAAVQPMAHGPMMVREKIFVDRGEIGTLFTIFMFIILFHYIILYYFKQVATNIILIILL
jgi:hypothetical protein